MEALIINTQKEILGFSIWHWI